ncbi:helix-turn-helix domain-containing protein [Paraburkholderia sp. XV]|uniref:helix-turn-helix domain-containing protein n=1 Tax=Paraburkholderia sp. XV TaxID=2831520 RepID=UPI001CD7BDE4|nr:helix-turn-helix domain-containing protein [Paraburkholderia sp. XV]
MPHTPHSGPLAHALHPVRALPYLTRWRLTLACSALKAGGERLAAIARQIGYDSAMAFSLAFRRMYGVSHGRYRIKSRVARDSDAVNVAEP